MTITKPLGNNIFQIDLIDGNDTFRTTGYLIKADKNILIETGSSASNHKIHQAFNELNLKPEDLDAIIVTHIHLDHSGGAGLLLTQCPNARLFVHPKGAKHLIDPEKLIAGARIVYGEMFDQLFNPVIAADPDRIEQMKDGQTLEIENGRDLLFLDTPGHAFHHSVIFDPSSRGIFSGDSMGIYFHRLFQQFGINFCLPVSAPPQFAPDLMLASFDKLESLNPERIFFTHFGLSENTKEIFKQARSWTHFLANECVNEYKSNRSADGLIQFIHHHALTLLDKKGVPKEFPDSTILLQDIFLNAQGIIAMVEKAASP